MSTQSLLSYATHPASTLRSPSNVDVQSLQSETTISRLRDRLAGSFIKQSKHGHARLKLIQHGGVSIPVYGVGGVVEGVVELDDVKTEGVDSIQVKIEGQLKLHESGEFGDSIIQLLDDTKTLWEKRPDSQECPKVIEFKLTLPTTFTTNDGETYPLPPTFEVKLKGIPGFKAQIEYSVSALINRPSTVPTMVPHVKSKALGLHVGTTIVNTPILYYPRSRPSFPIPRALAWIPTQGFDLSDEWSTYETVAKAKQSRLQDVVVKFHVPKSRVFCFTEKIPFYLNIESSAVSLAAFLPYAPTTGSPSPKVAMKVEVLRQTAVDVKYTTATLNQLAREDMWRVDCIGLGRFSDHLGNEKTTSAFSGEIGIFDVVQVCAFKAAGLHVKDCLVLSMTPLDPVKCPFRDFRLVIPIRLATNGWTADSRDRSGNSSSGAGQERVSQEQEYNVPSTPSDE
ncbi:hypothetical protein NP233_g2601 [Leucocoprinus birnbaumii]|uniref:Uncharacterized protein n=1 Tax=Leucocoprinus birnbaumii TaxID=56174 RepID=A0AAD5VZZ6_9AGAR|nr:hypothetical protein NP233_g2601 [Leucocoprinus birnbaumii]